MPRRSILFLLFLGLALGLGACKIVTPTKAPAEATQAPTAQPSATSPAKAASTLAIPAEGPTTPSCTVVSFFPTPDPTSLFPKISADDWTRGPLTATIKVIEYSDFQ